MKEPIKNKHSYKIHDEMYDLTDFVSLHPGGRDMFDNLKPNSNITSLIYSYHKNPKKILEIIPKYKIGSSCINTPQGDVEYTYDAYLELKKLVYDEMHEKKIPFFWSYYEIAYNTFMLFLYIGLYVYLFNNSKTISTLWFPFTAFFGLGYGGLVFHETSHYTGFKNQKINLFISNIIHSPFLTNKEWKHQHNYLHHNFTNTDNDFDFKHKMNDLFRHGNNHNLHFYNRFQFIYNIAIFLYAGFFLGPIRSIKYKRYNLLWIFVFYYFLGLQNTALLYAFYGLVFALIAQISHIQYECIQINTERKNDFLYNQVSSAINYKTENPLIRYFCFSLDIQIEHHLFPNIPHSSLRKIQHVVRSYCDANDIPYVEYPSIYMALFNYFKYMYRMGNPL